MEKEREIDALREKYEALKREVQDRKPREITIRKLIDINDGVKKENNTETEADQKKYVTEDRKVAEYHGLEDYILKAKLTPDQLGGIKQALSCGFSEEVIVSMVENGYSGPQMKTYIEVVRERRRIRGEPMSAPNEVKIVLVDPTEADPEGAVELSDNVDR